LNIFSDINKAFELLAKELDIKIDKNPRVYAPASWGKNKWDK